MSKSKFPNFSPKAAEFWAAIPADARRIILARVFCSNCHRIVSIVDFSASIRNGELLLRGSCAVCGHQVQRLVEGPDT
jgi:RNase P subunit RPR2